VKVVCPHCTKVYELREEQLRTFSETVLMPCPNCKATIEISLAGRGKEINEVPVRRKESLKNRILRTIDDLPPMPQVAQKARAVISDPDSSFSALAKIIETDQGIAARILRMANSSYYGLSGNISSLKHAAVVLGTRTLMELLTLACSSEILGKTLAGYDLEAGELWQHSLAVAYGSQLIARSVRPSLESDAFTAGLIHDVGKLILDAYLVESKENFKAVLGQGTETFLEAEKRILGFDHAELAAEVCSKWLIPAPIVLAVRCHHNPVPARGDVLSHIVHASDAISIMSGIGAGIDGMHYRMHPETVELFGLTGESVSVIMAEIALRVQKVSGEL